MDSNNWRRSQGTKLTIDTSDWKAPAELQPGARQRIVNKLMDSFKKHLPVSDPEGLLELQTSVQRFEEMLFTVATSTSDYLYQISMMSLTVETISRNTIANNMPSNQVGHSNKPPDQVNLNLMDSNSWRPNQGGTEPTVDTSNWRDELPPNSRQRIVDKIMDTLKKYLPVSGIDGLLELHKIAQRFEERIFIAATSQNDYLRKISMKMLTMENKSQNPVANNMPSNQVGPSNNLPDQVNINLMDSNSLGPNQGTELAMDTSDWRAQLHPCSRQRVINEIIDTLKKHIPVSCPEGLLELWSIAQTFEEKVFTASTSQSDYLHKISLKMFTMDATYIGPSNESLDQSWQRLYKFLCKN